jgi:SAM-dependent methyltransferase
MSAPVFTAHNIRLDDGTFTKPDAPDIHDDLRFRAARRALDLVFPEDKGARSIVDLGCLEGGYSVAFARMGMQATGIEVRDINYQCCMYVKERVNLPNLRFIQDDALNFASYGAFDAIFCCGLLYHFDKPRAFVEQLARQTRRLLILDTHFALEAEGPNPRFTLSEMTTHEGLKGRWFHEFDAAANTAQQQQMRWSSFGNSSSFWIKREHLIGLLRDVGFEAVYEVFDCFPGNVAEHLETQYPNVLRGMFLGIKR